MSPNALAMGMICGEAGTPESEPRRDSGHPDSMAEASGYSAEYYTTRHGDVGFHSELRLVRGLLPTPSGSRSLEIGCGGGALLAVLERRGDDAFGLDVNQAALKVAQRVAPGAHLAIGSATELPYRTASFRVLLAQHLVEHFERSTALLQEWRRVLVPGGTIILVTPNNNYPDPDCFFDPTHRHIFSRPELDRLLNESGFDVQHSGTFRPLLNLPFTHRLSALFARALRYIPRFREVGAVIVVSAKKRA
jgi:SAM-dependent methyltransferase